jgi:predicted glycoside hydrolase/deacetylase ChbG (UPF0249 family)
MVLRATSVVLVIFFLSSCTAPFRMAKPSPASAAVLEELEVDVALILTADDFGRNRATNLGIIKGIEEGLVSCVALMPVGSEVEHAYEYISRHPDLDVGVHLVLARDNVVPEWQPILPPEDVPTLVDNEGLLHTSLLYVLFRASSAEIEKELEAQIDAVIKNGIDPTFISFHKGFFQIHDTRTFNIVLRLAKKYRLPVRRQAFFHENSISEQGILSTDKLVYDYGSYPNHEKKKKFLSSIDWLPRGVTEFVLHLAVEGEDEKRVRSRATELRVVTDARVKDYVVKKNIRLIGYKHIRDMQRKMPIKEKESKEKRIL